jgi:stress response protein SCP2
MWVLCRGSQLGAIGGGDGRVRATVAPRRAKRSARRMTQMSKGGNTVLNAAEVEVALRWLKGSNTPVVEFLALLLNESGKVDSDDDLVFYNQRSHPTGRVRLGTRVDDQHASQAVHVDLSGMPASVARVLLVCATDSGDFGQVELLHMVILDQRSGAELVRFNLTGHGQSALIAGELYRRHNAWKFRAVDQGYASGLVGLAVDYGINVDADTTTSEPATIPTEASAVPAEDSIALPPHSGTLEISLAGVPSGSSTSDLSLSALAYSDRRELIDLVWFMHPVEFDNGIRLHQPPLPGSTDLSKLTLELAQLPEEVSSIVLTASSFRRKCLSDLNQLRVQLSDDRSGLRHSLPITTVAKDHSSVLIAVLTRDQRRQWSLVPVLEFHTERSGLDLVAPSAAVAGRYSKV